MACKILCLSLLLLLYLLLRSFEETGGSAIAGEHRIRGTNQIRTPRFKAIKQNEEKNNQFSVTPRRKKPNDRPELWPHWHKGLLPYAGHPGLLTATVTPGVNLGMNEYLVDVLIGTPPKRRSLILDTGSDLTWIQCAPCRDCFDQREPYFDPRRSNSFQNISCHDTRCRLVKSPPDLSRPCDANDSTQTCPYYYNYGDSSHTTGDFAAETFTFNLTSATGNSEFVRVKNLIFGCGHRNRVNFRGASGMLGLGRGPLSFSTQLQYLYGNAFSYCLVDSNAGRNATSKLVFGSSRNLSGHRPMNFTSFVTKRPNLDETFYYLQIESVSVGGEVLTIPKETWEVSPDGSGGTVIDSGATLSFFIEPAYEIIREAFAKKVRGYPVVEDERFDLCYRASGKEELDMPEFRIAFDDGAEWNFPAENVFMRFEPEGIVCLAILRIDNDWFSIIGNYQQKNFHVLYDRGESRLGFTTMRCADV
ncbi:hypothetical protein CRG98_023931 [Punica granatum]|nr:hypothetical protein CRG98_023931 [Punica granatum]